MVFVDPATGKRYAEPGDYFGDEFSALNGMAATVRVRYIGASRQCTTTLAKPSPDLGYVLGNSAPGTFVLAGTGIRVAGTAANSVPTRTFETDTDGVNRLRQYVDDYFGDTFADMVDSTDTYLEGVPGCFRVDGKFWIAGQAWPVVHPMMTTTSGRMESTATDVFNPYEWRLSAAGGVTTPRWVRWRFRRSIDAGVQTSSFPVFGRSPDFDQVVAFPGGRIPSGNAYCYYRFSDLAGNGGANVGESSALYGLSGGNVNPYGNHKDVPGMIRVAPSSVGASTDWQPYSGSQPTVSWDRDKPFRIRMYVVTAAADASATTGEAIFDEPGVQLWYDVEVTKASAIGPELPAQFEPLLAEARPRVTSRIRLNVGIDGGTP